MTQDLQALAAMRPGQPIQQTSTIPTTTQQEMTPPTATNTSSQPNENHNLYEIGAKRSYLKSLWSTKINVTIKVFRFC